MEQVLTFQGIIHMDSNIQILKKRNGNLLTNIGTYVIEYRHLFLHGTASRPKVVQHVPYAIYIDNTLTSS